MVRKVLLVGGGLRPGDAIPALLTCDHRHCRCVWRLGSLLARPMPGPTPWLGLAERVNIYATMLWMAVLSASFLRVQDRASTGPIR